MTDFEIKVDDVTTADGHELFLVAPVAAPVGPGLIFLHWFDEAPNANRTQYLDEARQLARQGVVSILPQLSFPWHEIPRDIEHDRWCIEGEVSFLNEVHGLLTGVDGVEANRVAVVGHDFGAMYATLLIRSIGVRCAVLVAPTPRWSDWFLPFWPIESDRFDYMRALHPFDPIVALTEISCPVLFQFGTDDFYIAPMTGSEIYQAANEPKQLSRYPATHAMDLDEIGADRMTFLVEHLALDVR